MGFVAFTLILAAFLAAAAVLVEVLLPRAVLTPSNSARSRVAGAVLGLVCVLWSTHYILLMLEGGMSRYHNLAILLMAILALLCLVYLDYLSARALGGLVLLCVNAALHEAFVIHLPARGVYALLCYLLAVAAMVCIGMPWRFRQLLEKTVSSPVWRHAAGGLLALAAVILLGFTVAA